MKIAELKRLLKAGEWNDIEFKEARTAVPKSAFETVSAFANTHGGWLVFGWPAADQLIFIRVADRKVVAVSNVSREFDPGAVGPVAFPRIAGWCCPSEAAAEAP